MSLSSPQPNMQGFADSQQFLRDNFGRDIRFYSPSDMLYDPGIPASAFDDEGIPLDPLAGASAVNPAAVSIDNLTYTASGHCNVVFRPLQTSILRRDQTIEDAIAIRSGLNRDLIMAPEDAGLVTGAEYFEVGTLTRDSSDNIVYPEQWTPDDNVLWKIVSTNFDSFGTVQRFIVFGQNTQ